jgi:organic hydroperoxide reductase OsmC/OhrA
VKLSKLAVTVDSESDDRGILGMDASIPAGPLSMRVSVSLAADGLEEPALRNFAEWAMEHCPVADAVGRGVDVKLEVN